MRKIIFVLFIVSFCFCKVKNTTKSEICNHDFIKEIQYLSTFLIESDFGVYDFDSKKIVLPNKFDTLKWNIHGEEITNLDSISTSYMIYRQNLEELINDMNKCSFKLSKEKFLNAFKPETHTGTPNSIFSLYYRFNNRRKPNCFNYRNRDILKYTDCNSIRFSFDEKNYLINVDTDFFNP